MKLDYEVIHANRKTIRITVERDRKVVVRVPQQASQQVVAAAIESKRFWIWQKLRDPNKYPNPAPRKEYVSGETFLFLGQNYELAYTHNDTDSIEIVGRQLAIGRGERSARDGLFQSWYLSQAKTLMTPRIAALAAEIGVSYKRISVRSLKYRWGSCSPKGTLTFNWRIIQAPMIVVDYLIVHELAHVLEPNHSKDFWNIVSIHAPSWIRARDWLRTHGSELEW